MGDLEGEAPRDRRIEHLAEASGLISKKWDAAILYALLEDGPLRFNELKERLGTVSAKVLSESLDDLGSADLVERRVLSESPLRVEYATSAAGEDMRPVIEGLVEWSEEHVAGDRPLVVVADDDRRIAGMHAEWLDEEYRVETCSAPADVLTATDETPDVAVLDRGPVGVGSGLLRSGPRRRRRWRGRADEHPAQCGRRGTRVRRLPGETRRPLGAP